jgi:CBS domain-containing protein
MLDNGFLQRPQHGDLRDLILRPYSQRDTVVVGPKDLLTTAYQRMKLYDVSQLPVMEGNQLVGIIDESDVLLHVYGDEARFRDPVSVAMVSKLEKLDVKSPIEPGGDHHRRRGVSRSDHPHRPAELFASPGSVTSKLMCAASRIALSRGRFRPVC